ncbi:indole-3-glycerol-phosphate synthase [Desulfoplanes formicivorans]|uniref:indole-3-glycerol-phosphate synthase n=1 Tax=Desulfoplanes formicivorans TaxID=1592317 RepID=A0A194AJQ7_9BACT|nr:indole-3-glycerol-phosphate synthase [Desulfoplanes formicivorans]GAU09475.1 indole-3-glycerol phosphate synthase [Desulfoplanes formicivorans]
MPLSRFVKAKEEELTRLRSLKQLPAPYRGKRPGFAEAIRGQMPGAIIAEYKRASPSKGDINLTMSPEEVGSMYARAGASAISVLTEETYFKGDLSYLHIMAKTGLPLLRKDFITHPLQVAMTASTPASAILVIVRLFETDAELNAVLRECQTFGLEPVVEAFDAHDLQRAQSLGARIIQINNRDLATLGIDLNRSYELVTRKQKHETWISASGITTPQAGQKMFEAGFDALLMGTALMASDHPGRMVERFTRNGS